MQNIRTIHGVENNHLRSRFASSWKKLKGSANVKTHGNWIPEQKVSCKTKGTFKKVHFTIILGGNYAVTEHIVCIYTCRSTGPNCGNSTDHCWKHQSSIWNCSHFSWRVSAKCLAPIFVAEIGHHIQDVPFPFNKKNTSNIMGEDIYVTSIWVQLLCWKMPPIQLWAAVNCDSMDSTMKIWGMEKKGCKIRLLRVMVGSFMLCDH